MGGLSKQRRSHIVTHLIIIFGGNQMSQQLPRIDLPELLYWEIMQAAEENKRTLAEEVLFRLRQKHPLNTAMPAVERE